MISNAWFMLPTWNFIRHWASEEGKYYREMRINVRVWTPLGTKDRQPLALYRCVRIHWNQSQKKMTNRLAVVRETAKRSRWREGLGTLESRRIDVPNFAKWPSISNLSKNKSRWSPTPYCIIVACADNAATSGIPIGRAYRSIMAPFTTKTGCTFLGFAVFGYDFWTKLGSRVIQRQVRDHVLQFAHIPNSDGDNEQWEIKMVKYHTLIPYCCSQWAKSWVCWDWHWHSRFSGRTVDTTFPSISLREHRDE